MENITFSSQFIEIFDHLCQKFGIAIDWTAQNVIPYVTALCGRMIKYIIFKDIILIFVVAGIFYLLWRLTALCCRKENKWDPDFHYGKILNDSYVFGWISRGAGAILSIAWIVKCVLTIIRCVYLPEFVIVDYLSGYIA